MTVTNISSTTLVTCEMYIRLSTYISGHYEACVAFNFETKMCTYFIHTHKNEEYKPRENKSARRNRKNIYTNEQLLDYL
jgi:hypothetical protein